MTASHTTTDDARIPDHCGWAARGYWREAYDDAVAALRRVTAERDFMHSCGVIELMIRNPNVDSYVKEWEARAEVAKTKVATLRAELDASRGRVKPLVWTQIAITKEHKGLSGVWLCAWGINGQYEVHVFDTDPTHVMLNGPDIVPTAIYTTIEAAKSAAQADYTARILSALEPDPAVVRMREALELAANRLHRCSVDYDTGTYEFIETGEWADEARAALQEE